ncbi:MAG: hypothetical protein DDT26_01959 [Dehalococcoidia bacterium]|nr:hypothetical protein [Chloroflexota bacterium]
MLSKEDWDRAAGIECPKCKTEVFRITEGLCLRCWGDLETRRAEKMEDKAERRYYANRLRMGDISLSDLRTGRF